MRPVLGSFATEVLVKAPLVLYPDAPPYISALAEGKNPPPPTKAPPTGPPKKNAPPVKAPPAHAPPPPKDMPHSRNQNIVIGRILPEPIWRYHNIPHDEHLTGEGSFDLVFFFSKLEDSESILPAAQRSVEISSLRGRGSRRVCRALQQQERQLDTPDYEGQRYRV